MNNWPCMKNQSIVHMINWPCMKKLTIVHFHDHYSAGNDKVNKIETQRTYKRLYTLICDYMFIQSISGPEAL